MTKKFHFRHQPLLEVATQRERSVQIELSQAYAAEIEARRRLDATVRLAAEWDARIRCSQKGSLQPHLLSELLHATEGLRQRTAKERDAVQAAVKQVEAVRERLQEAARDRKSYERLRERTQTEYEVETSRQLVKLSDDTASVRAATAMIGRESGMIA